jgi:hypothetical protein
MHAEFDGSGFPLAYLFLEHNGKCGDGIRTEIITKFVLQLKEKGLDPEFILTDKDWAQIKACHSTWPKAKIQLCRWHINRAITTRLQSDQMVARDTYNGYIAHQIFSFIDPNFIQPLMVPRGTKFCPKELRKPCWNLMDIHLHQHILIPNKNEIHESSKKIWTNAVYEMYQFCFQHNLPWLWSYMWREWYGDNRWYLWMRAGYDSKISVLKTTMFVEAHWKVLKRDFLYKFFRPRLDLVIYIINKKVIVHQKRRFEQIIMGRERPDWKSTFKSEWRLLAKRQLSTEQYITDVHNWVCGCRYFLTNRFFLCKHLVKLKGDVDLNFFDVVTRNNSYPFIFESIESTKSFSQPFWKIDSLENNTNDNKHEECEDLYNHLIIITENTLQILKEQKGTGNLKWAKSVEKNFYSINKMQEEIKSYQRSQKMPLTWKGHTHNTRYLR